MVAVKNIWSVHPNPDADLPDHRSRPATRVEAYRRLTIPAVIQRWILHRLQQLPDVAELT